MSTGRETTNKRTEKKRGVNLCERIIETEEKCLKEYKLSRSERC